MTDAPKLSQSTSIAKSTATDDRLNAILPSMATEYSPVRVYLPTTTAQLDPAQRDGRPLPDGTERYVWVAPDANGDGSDYTVEVECIGAGGGGAGSANELGSGVNKVASSNTGTASTTATMTTTVATGSGDTLIAVISAGNVVAQTASLTDSLGNAYSLASSGQSSTAGTVWVYVCYNAQALPVGSTVTFTSTNSQVVNAALLWAPAITGPSEVQPTVTSSTTSGTQYTATGNWNAGDAVVLAVFNNSSANWNSTLSGLSSPYWSIDGVNSQASGTERLSVFFGNPPAAWSGASDNLTVTASTTSTGMVGVLIPFSYAHTPVASSPGGGGGGAEYAAETSYPVSPDKAYVYQIGNQGNGGLANQDGTDGGDTIFDISGQGIVGGVTAHGGGGGQAGGNPGAGGTGSTNSVHFDGGSGGTSSAGIGSDKPTLYSSAVASDSNYFRFTFDESTANNVAYDSGQNNRGTTRHIPSGTVIRSTSASDSFFTPLNGFSAPIQVPPSNKSGTTAGNFKRMVLNGNGQGGGFEITSVPKHRITSFSMSAWIRGGSEAANSRDWGGTDYSVILGSSALDGSIAGYSVYMKNGLVTVDVGDSVSSGMHAFSNSSVSATDGKWHLVQVSFTPNTIIIWIDGALDSTWNGTCASVIAVGDFNPTIGFNLATGWNGFAGELSNVWFTSVNLLNATTVAQMYGTSPSTGGGGGGASGGSAGPGNAGSNSSGAGGGAGGAGSATVAPPGVLGSSAGTSGGAAGASGATGLSTQFGSGGGGAGKSASNLSGNSTVYSMSSPASRSATYTGNDATSSGGILYSNSNSLWSEGDLNPVQTISTPLCITGGKPELPANGTMGSVIEFPVIGNLPVWDGSTLGASKGTSTRWAIDHSYLTLTVNSTNASMIGVSSVSNQDMPSELTDTELASWNSSGSITGPQLYYVPSGDAGRQVTLTLSSSITTEMLSSSSPVFIVVSTFRGAPTKDMLIGGYSDPESGEFYCEFYGAGTEDAVQDAALSFDFHYNNGSTLVPLSGASGRPGQIRVSYLNPEGKPVTTILPTAATDNGGNQLAAGITTGDISTWHPGSNNSVLESGWTNGTISATHDGTSFFQVKRVALNAMFVRLYLHGGNMTGNQTIAQLPAGYWPTVGINTQVGVFYTTVGSASAHLYFGGDGHVELDGISSSTVAEIYFCGIIPLD